MKRRHEKPIPRVNPSGRKVWIARYTDRHGKRKSAGTFELKGPCRAEAPDADCCGQHAIDAAYDRMDTAVRRRDTLGSYAASWTERHPRARRTNDTYNHRLSRVLDIPVEGLPLRDWPLGDLRRRQAIDVLNELLTKQKRSAAGAQGILRVLSALMEDAISDDLADGNAFRGVRVRATDPRVTKLPREIRVYSWEEMHRFAHVARQPKMGSGPMAAWRHVYAEAMVGVFSDCGLRLGEVLALRQSDVKLRRCDEAGCRAADVPHLHVRFTAHNGRVEAGTKTDHGKSGAGRVAPLSPRLEALLAGLPPRIDSVYLFPTPRGRLWRERNFYRDVWDPARQATGIWATPHEFRHSWVSHLRAAMVDPADLANAAGHTLETATERYTHSLGRSYEQMRNAVGE